MTLKQHLEDYDSRISMQARMKLRIHGLDLASDYISKSMLLTPKFAWYTGLEVDSIIIDSSNRITATLVPPQDVGTEDIGEGDESYDAE